MAPARPLFVASAALVLAACGGATNTAAPTPTATTVEVRVTRTATVQSTAVDLAQVPDVDVSRRSVPLDEVVFDTFDGRFTRLGDASARLIRSLSDRIRPIYNPVYGDASGLPWLRDDDLVLGYVSESGAYAYPIKVLNFREIVNDVIGGEPVLVSYCPLCGSGVVYSRVLDGRTLLFGNTSALHESDMVMFDHQTGSYWFQVGGSAIVGELTESRLRPLPSMTLTWGDWKASFPDTRLLVGDGRGALDPRYASNPFSGYPANVDAGRFSFPVSEDRLDGRLRPSEVVVTLEIDESVRAYPIGLIGGGVVNDEVGGEPVVIFVQRDGLTGTGFLSTVSGRRLTFAAEGEAVTDLETGSTWDSAGTAVAGPLAGTVLERVPNRRAFWFSLAGALRGVELYEP